MKKHVQECHEEEDEVDTSALPTDDGKFGFLCLKSLPKFLAWIIIVVVRHDKEMLMIYYGYN
jgi:hypothetical protein